MGQYRILANWDKKEWVDPHKIGLGLKQAEQIGAFHASMGDIPYLLVSISNGRGGGDVPTEGLEDILGRWAGDRVLVVGDYSEEGDVNIVGDDGLFINPRKEIYTPCQDRAHPQYSEWDDISIMIDHMIEALWGYRMSGGGWRSRKLVQTGTYLGPWKGEIEEDNIQDATMRPNMVIGIKKEE